MKNWHHQIDNSTDLTGRPDSVGVDSAIHLYVPILPAPAPQSHCMSRLCCRMNCVECILYPCMTSIIGDRYTSLTLQLLDLPLSDPFLLTHDVIIQKLCVGCRRVARSEKSFHPWWVMYGNNLSISFPSAATVPRLASFKNGAWTGLGTPCRCELIFSSRLLQWLWAIPEHEHEVARSLGPGSDSHHKTGFSFQSQGHQPDCGRNR